MQRSHSRLLLVCVALYAGAMACADILGIQGGELGDGSVTDSGPSDGLPPYDGSGKDVIDLGDANFAQCDGGTDDTTNAVYVSNSHPNRNTNAQTCGAATQPCTSIQVAMGVAAQRTPRKVILANDTFDEVIEFDAQTHDMVVEGGYFLDYTQADTNGNPAWVYQCTTNLAHIVPSTDSRNYTVHFAGATNETLRLLTVQTRPQAIKYSESLHAILVVDSTVTLDNVVAVAQNGGDGPTGNPGGAQMSCTTPGGNGGNGNVGASGGAGVFDATAGFVAQVAGNGTQGQLGTYTAPAIGQCDTDCGSCNPSFNMDGGGSTCNISYSQQCGNAGGPGCAGVGGYGGWGGGGGGGSIAVYASGSSTVTLANGTSFFANSGGAGGAGGAGTSGASGQTGFAGTTTTCIEGCGFVDGSSCSASSSHQLAAGTAGSGGQGGTGGQGGGGHGGPAYLLVRVQPANVVGANLISNGDGGLGSGGAGGGPNGDAGESVRYKVYP